MKQLLGFITYILIVYSLLFLIFWMDANSLHTGTITTIIYFTIPFIPLVLMGILEKIIDVLMFKDMYNASAKLDSVVSFLNDTGAYPMLIATSLILWIPAATAGYFVDEHFEVEYLDRKIENVNYYNIEKDRRDILLSTNTELSILHQYQTRKTFVLRKQQGDIQRVMADWMVAPVVPKDWTKEMPIKMWAISYEPLNSTLGSTPDPWFKESTKSYKVFKLDKTHTSNFIETIDASINKYGFAKNDDFVLVESINYSSFEEGIEDIKGNGIFYFIGLTIFFILFYWGFKNQVIEMVG